MSQGPPKRKREDRAVVQAKHFIEGFCSCLQSCFVCNAEGHDARHPHACSTHPGYHCAWVTALNYPGHEAKISNEFQLVRENFPSRMRLWCKPRVRESQHRRFPPAFCIRHRRCDLLWYLWSAFGQALEPRTRARISDHAHAHALTHTCERVTAARSATLSGAPSRAQLPPVVVGRKPRLPTLLSNGLGSRIGPACGTTPARLLHSSDTRASRDI